MNFVWLSTVNACGFPQSTLHAPTASYFATRSMLAMSVDFIDLLILIFFKNDEFGQTSLMWTMLHAEAIRTSLLIVLFKLKRFSLED